MKKFISLVVIVILFILAIRLVPLGTKSMTMGASLVNLDVPKLSSLSEECCTYSATFKTIRGEKVIGKEIKELMESYQKKNCNGKIYHYDPKNNVTIIDYEVIPGIIFNKFKINYKKGNTCE